MSRTMIERAVAAALVLLLGFVAVHNYRVAGREADRLAEARSTSAELAEDLAVSTDRAEGLATTVADLEADLSATADELDVMSSERDDLEARAERLVDDVADRAMEVRTANRERDDAIAVAQDLRIRFDGELRAEEQALHGAAVAADCAATVEDGEGARPSSVGYRDVWLELFELDRPGYGEQVAACATAAFANGVLVPGRSVVGGEDRTPGVYVPVDAANDGNPCTVTQELVHTFEDGDTIRSSQEVQWFDGGAEDDIADDPLADSAWTSWGAEVTIGLPIGPVNLWQGSTVELSGGCPAFERTDASLPTVPDHTAYGADEIGESFDPVCHAPEPCLRPGTYGTSGTGSSCYWEVVHPVTGDIIDNHFGASQTQVTLRAGTNFRAERCGDWERR
ncbi:hypothetical protein DVS28_a2895 [Euzebya pacifica]|uniref:Uncharacterized protein n=1 Tax=Euzebya pacifica TaxID=1608957 RepID=A0A346XZC7_9ACTN|nr:hypothetical protein [Euzebya pacifica]AXV07574.1 hypothetical protein DVS28_a2895 [Euzebya pacifica]